MPARNCYVITYQDYDGDAYVYGVYGDFNVANNIVVNNNTQEEAARQWDDNALAYPAIELPERPTFNKKHQPPSNTVSKEYLQWLTDKLAFEAKDKEWMMLRVKLQDERQAAIKVKFGERPFYYIAMTIQETDYHE